MFHGSEWSQLIDLPTTTPILSSIFGGPEYFVYGSGGDLALPGAIEYQGPHSDNVWTELHSIQSADPGTGGGARGHRSEPEEHRVHLAVNDDQPDRHGIDVVGDRLRPYGSSRTT
ncbi:MAG: hypothetical protein ACI81L_001641, partial [Verrucomicrobiales bacterium]